MLPLAGRLDPHPSQTIAVRHALANEQHPHAIVVACSDSRVLQELVFDQGLGELFVVHEAGNEMEPLAIASIEYCVAVKACRSIPDGQSTGSPNLGALISSMKSNLIDTHLTW